MILSQSWSHYFSVSDSSFSSVMEAVAHHFPRVGGVYHQHIRLTPWSWILAPLSFLKGNDNGSFQNSVYFT